MLQLSVAYNVQYIQDMELENYRTFINSLPIQFTIQESSENYCSTPQLLHALYPCKRSLHSANAGL